MPVTAVVPDGVPVFKEPRKALHWVSEPCVLTCARQLPFHSPDSASSLLCPGSREARSHGCFNELGKDFTGHLMCRSSVWLQAELLTLVFSQQRKISRYQMTFARCFKGCGTSNSSWEQCQASEAGPWGATSTPGPLCDLGKLGLSLPNAGRGAVLGTLGGTRCAWWWICLLNGMVMVKAA